MIPPTLDADTVAAIAEKRWADLWQPQGPVVVLNHGSYGRTFKAVRDYHSALQRETDTDPGHFYRHNHHETIEASAETIRHWLGVPNELGAGFTHNASTAVLDAVAWFASPDGPIMTTDIGYGGTRYGVDGVAQRIGTAWVEVELDSTAHAVDFSDIVMAAVAKHRPSVIVLDQITSATAMRLPIEELIPRIRIASPATKIVIDAAHAAGMERRPYVAGADAWVANLHKWVCASTGAAVIVAGRGSDLKPAFRSWTSDEAFPGSFTWLGTDSKAAYLSAPLATQILDGLVAADLDGHIRSILAEAGDLLVDAWGVEPDPRPVGMAAPWMRLIEVPHHRPLPQEDLNGASLLVRDQLDADVIFTQFKGKTFVRLSAHGYNTLDQYDRLVAIPDVIRGY